MLTNLEPHDVLFIDEIHRLSSRSGEVNEPARVVAPIRVNGGRSILIERAAGPSPIMISSW
jgi:hypothetical protein